MWNDFLQEMFDDVMYAANYVKDQSGYIKYYVDLYRQYAKSAEGGDAPEMVEAYYALADRLEATL